MSPRLTKLDPADCGLGHAVVCGDVPLMTVVTADCDHVVISELGVAVANASRVSTLEVPVQSVHQLGAKKQVVRVNTRPIVAPMADTKSGFDPAVQTFPCKAVREHLKAFAGSLYDAVSVFVCGSYPVPAICESADRGNAAPKPDFGWDAMRWHSQILLQLVKAFLRQQAVA